MGCSEESEGVVGVGGEGYSEDFEGEWKGCVLERKGCTNKSGLEENCYPRGDFGARVRVAVCAGAVDHAPTRELIELDS